MDNLHSHALRMRPSRPIPPSHGPSHTAPTARTCAAARSASFSASTVSMRACMSSITRCRSALPKRGSSVRLRAARMRRSSFVKSCGCVATWTLPMGAGPGDDTLQNRAPAPLQPWLRIPTRGKVKGLPRTHDCAQRSVAGRGHEGDERHERRAH